MFNIDFPWRIDGAGKTATNSDYFEHVVEMLLQFLLTHPHERVNRPDFGTPLRRMCFEGNSQGTAEVIQFIAKAGLHRWLGDEIEVVQLSVETVDATLIVILNYRIRGETEIRDKKFPFPRGAA